MEKSDEGGTTSPQQEMKKWIDIKRNNETQHVYNTHNKMQVAQFNNSCVLIHKKKKKKSMLRQDNNVNA